MADLNFPSMFDTRYAIDRQMELDAQKVGQAGGGSKRYGMYYNSALGGDLRNQGLMGLAQLIGGSPDPRIAKQQALDEVMQRFPEPETPEDLMEIANALQASGLYNEAAQATKMATEMRASMPTATKPAADIEKYNEAVKGGYKGSFFQYQIDLKQAAKDNNISIGNIPQDYIITTGADGKITMEVIPGSPTDIANKAAIDTGGVAAARKAVQSGVVLEDIGRLKDAITNDSLINPASSSILSYIMENPIIGSGKNRIDAISLATTIKSSIGFDRLQQMREESPTGGALGQVSELELVTLQATLGSLDLNQSKENLLYNLERLGEIYVQIFTKLTAYPNFEKYFGGAINTSDTPIEDPDPLGIL